MQRHQHHKFILNQPQKICTSTQNHWKDKSVINNFHVYEKIQLKTETSKKDTRTRNGQSATEQFARRVQLLAVASDEKLQEKCDGKSLSNHEIALEDFIMSGIDRSRVASMIYSIHKNNGKGIGFSEEKSNETNLKAYCECIKEGLKAFFVT